MTSIAVIDYGLCNLDSIARALEECGGEVLVTDSPEDIRAAEKLVLPGVGSFAEAMKNLHASGNAVAIRDMVAKDTPFLGICLGMQLLATRGAEAGESEGLGLIAGRVEKLRATRHDERVPHMGWNEVVRQRDDVLFDSLPENKDFYFVHSYHLVCDDRNVVVATTSYCGEFVSCVNAGSIWGAQFHPEKSQKAGFELLKRFVSL